MSNDAREQLRARLRNAERRLAQAERAQVNTASAQYSGYAGTDQGRGDTTGKLNKQIAAATRMDELRAEVAELRSRLNDDGPRLWGRLRRAWGRR